MIKAIRTAHLFAQFKNKEKRKKSNCHTVIYSTFVNNELKFDSNVCIYKPHLGVKFQAQTVP